MPVMKYLNPDGSYSPLPGGGGGGANEVTISTSAPTDGSELWLDSTTGTLYYRVPADGTYASITAPGSVDGNIEAGSGLTGGGPQSTNPILNVGQGTGITVSADSVAVNKSTLDTWYAPAIGQAATTITNWNSAVNNGVIYQANGATNAPDTGWWMGFCVSRDANYKHQMLWPFANARWNSSQIFEREMENGVWGDWNRLAQYYYSRDAMDSMHYAQHNATAGGMGYRRFSWGMYKDKGTNAPSAGDQWRVQCYDTAGTYTWTAIQVAESGAVTFPKGHSLLRTQLAAAEPVRASEVATVGLVVDLVTRLLQRAGVTVDPADVISLMEEPS